MCIVWFIPSQGWALEILRGRGVSTAQFLYRGMNKLEISEGGGGGAFKPKAILGGGVDIFLSYTLLKCTVL